MASTFVINVVSNRLSISCGARGRMNALDVRNYGSRQVTNTRPGAGCERLEARA